MATHSTILAWRILWTEETGGLLSIESQNQTQLKRLSSSSSSSNELNILFYTKSSKSVNFILTAHHNS